jgi:hypothetical protein
MISAGEWVTASGEWTNDRTHGQHAQSSRRNPAGRPLGGRPFVF